VLFCRGEAFFKAISEPGVETWPVFRVLPKYALDLKPGEGMKPEKSATAINRRTGALGYRLSKNGTPAVSGDITSGDRSTCALMSFIK